MAPVCMTCYITCNISEDRVLRKEGGGGLEEGSRVVCVKNKGVRYHIVSRRNGVYTNLPLLVHV